MPRKNLITVALGRKGTGKSEKLWTEYTSKKSRVLSLDSLGESAERDSDTVETLGWSQLMAAFAAVHRGRYTRWHIAAALEPDDMRELFTLLAPTPGGTEPSLAEAFGGMAVECGEAYELAPNGKTPDEILAGWRRGRHYGLDLYMASQRPSSCAREVTAAADHIYAFAQSEPADLKFLAESISRPVAVKVSKLTGHECVYYNRDTAIAQHLAANGRVLASLNTMGEAALAGR